MPQLKLRQNNGKLVECWNDGELEYRIIFPLRVSPFHHSITPMLPVPSGKLAYFQISNSRIQVEINLSGNEQVLIFFRIGDLFVLLIPTNQGSTVASVSQFQCLLNIFICSPIAIPNQNVFKLGKLVSMSRKEYESNEDSHQDDLEQLLIFHGRFVISMWMILNVGV